MPYPDTQNAITPLEAATEYLKLGLSLVPLAPNDKFPDDEALIASGHYLRNNRACWKPFQTRKPNAKEIETWFGKTPINMGVVTGYEDTYALDFDYEDRYHHWASLCPEWAERLPTQKTGRGFHVLFRVPGIRSTSYRILLPTRLISQPDAPEVASFLGRGTWMTAWPSIHPSGFEYRWLEGRSPWEKGIPEIGSMADLNLKIEREKLPVGNWIKHCFTNPEKARASLACYLMRKRGAETNMHRVV